MAIAGSCTEGNKRQDYRGSKKHTYCTRFPSRVPKRAPPSPALHVTCCPYERAGLRGISTGRLRIPVGDDDGDDEDDDDDQELGLLVMGENAAILAGVRARTCTSSCLRSFA